MVSSPLPVRHLPTQAVLPVRLMGASCVPFVNPSSPVITSHLIYLGYVGKYVPRKPKTNDSASSIIQIIDRSSHVTASPQGRHLPTADGYAQDLPQFQLFPESVRPDECSRKTIAVWSSMGILQNSPEFSVVSVRDPSGQLFVHNLHHP